MSLARLSTDLDTKIAKSLAGDTKTLSAFSKVSNVRLIEVFEWTRRDMRGPNFGHLNNFRGLRRLHRLMIDVDLIVPSTDNTLEALAEPHSLFPGSLRSLTLDSFTVDRSHRLVSKFLREIGDVDNLGEAVSKALKYLASKFKPLKTLTLGIDMDGEYAGRRTKVFELKPEDVVFFRYAAEELQNRLGVDCGANAWSI